MTNTFTGVLQDLIRILLPKALPAITEGLQDLDDDVRAVAAASLVPIVDSLVKLQFKQVSGRSQHLHLADMQGGFDFKSLVSKA